MHYVNYYIFLLFITYKVSFSLIQQQNRPSVSSGFAVEVLKIREIYKILFMILFYHKKLKSKQPVFTFRRYLLQLNAS